MAFKMKGFDPGKGTGMNKSAMKMAKKSAMQKKFPDLNKDGKVTQADILMGKGVIDSPKKMKKSPMKKEVVDNTSYARARREKARLKKEREDKRAKSTTFVDKTTAQYKKSSAMKKLDPPAKQAKIKKMIIAGIEKGKDDRDILKKINSMSDGNVEYTYNRKTKQVKVRPKGASGFEGELETDPDKG
tara:strand:- start:677 stop:1237 length:561 start_codon:yes stop_codon:yes gene_type:complete